MTEITTPTREELEARVSRYKGLKEMTTRDNELKGVLTQDQWKKYKKLKDELKDQVSAMAELKKKQE